MVNSNSPFELRDQGSLPELCCARRAQCVETRLLCSTEACRTNPESGCLHSFRSSYCQSNPGIRSDIEDDSEFRLRLFWCSEGRRATRTSLMIFIIFYHQAVAVRSRCELFFRAAQILSRKFGPESSGAFNVAGVGSFRLATVGTGSLIGIGDRWQTQRL